MSAVPPPYSTIPNSKFHTQRTEMDCHITFIAFEKLGILASQFHVLGDMTTKRSRQSQAEWLYETFARLSLIAVGHNYRFHSVSLGVDATGNYGAFIVQERIQPEDPST